jgi:hypothetical protein
MAAFKDQALLFHFSAKPAAPAGFGFVTRNAEIASDLI